MKNIIKSHKVVGRTSKGQRVRERREQTQRGGNEVTRCSGDGVRSLKVKLLNVPLPKRKVARWTLPLSCGYSGVHTLLAECVHALR